MANSKRALVLGAGGFIGTHMVTRLRQAGFFVRGVDLKKPEFSESQANEFFTADLRDQTTFKDILDVQFDEIYQFAADMGGAAYVFTGEHDADILHNSNLINLNLLKAAQALPSKIFYASSACVYPASKQADPGNPDCAEASAYPADPDSDYGWEKLFGERLYSAFARNYGLNVRIARFHNVFGPLGTWRGGREKAPAAICRKVAEAPNGAQIEIWGDGLQTRSFLHIDECLEGVRRLMDSEVTTPINIGSEEMLAINELARKIVLISGKDITIRNANGPTGVRGRRSDNRMIREKLSWAPSIPLEAGLRDLYRWILTQVEATRP